MVIFTLKYIFKSIYKLIFSKHKDIKILHSPNSQCLRFKTY